MSRKPAPAPIKIPNHPSKVQIQHSASASHSDLKETAVLFPPMAHESSNTLQPGTVHPPSAISLNDDSSAISGTTLARALIANSFILPSDSHGRNRYKSGGNFAKQDSATLPGANDNGPVISPYWRDRRISGGEVVHSPDGGVESHIPPVPPIPASLSSAAPHVRHTLAEVPGKPLSRSQSLRTDHLSRRPSKKSRQRSSLEGAIAGPFDNSTPSPTQIPASGSNPRPPLPQPPSNQPILPHDNSSDQPLPNPPSPRDPPPDLAATSPEPAPVSIRRSQPPPSLNLPPPSASTDGEGSVKIRPSPSENQDEPQRTGVSSNTVRTEQTMGSATSGEDIAKVLTAYRFGSPLKSSFPVRLHESPDPSTPSLSPWSGGSKSHRSDTSNSMSFPQTPTTTSRRSRNGVSLCSTRSVATLDHVIVGLSILDIRRAFANSNMPSQRQSGSSRSSRLPIGNDRPRSLHVPSSPFSRKSDESRRSTDDGSPATSNPNSSGVSSPDILDFMFIPSAPSLPSRPHPIKVVRESLDSFEGVADGSPSTTEVLRQTFPETPQAFSPLFSANVGTPGVPPVPSSSVGTSGTPLSVAHTRGMLKRGTPNPAITRAASLYTRKTPSSSNRTRMSPIPSAPVTPESPENRKVNDVRKSSRFEVQQSQAAANLLTVSFSTPGRVPSPPPSSPRRNSDPTGRVSKDLETFAGRVDLLEEAPPSTPEVKELGPEPSEGVPSQRLTPASLEKSPSPSARSLNVVDGEGGPSTADSLDENKDEDNVGVGSASRVAQSDKTRPTPKQRPRALDLPAVNSDGESSTNDGIVTKNSDGSSRPRQGEGSARSTPQTDATSQTSALAVVSTETTTPATTPAQTPSAASDSPLKIPEESPSLHVNVPPSPALSYLSSSNPSLRSAFNVSATPSPSPSSQRSPAQPPSEVNPTPTSTSQVQNTSPALPSSTLVSPTRHNQQNSLDIPSFASFLRQSYGDLAVIHPPPPYQTAILSQAISVDGENAPPARSGTSLPSYVHTPPDRQSGGLRPARPAQHNITGLASASGSIIRERSGSAPDIRMPRNRPLGPRKPSGSQGQNKVSSLETYRLRAGSVSSVHSNPLRSVMTPSTSRKPSTASIRGRTAPRFPTVPVRWRGYTLDVARWTFTSQQLQEIASRAIGASAESYYVRLLKLETLDTELPEELHRLELLTTDLKTKIRATVSARKELLDDLIARTAGMGVLDHHELERVMEELGTITQLTDELNDELYTVADQIAQLKRLRDVHSSSALALSLRKLNTSFLRQAAENQLLRERVAALEAERDIAWTQAEHVAQEFDDLSTKLEQDATSTPSSTNNSRRASRVSAVRKSSIRVSKSGLRHSIVGKTNSRASNRSSSISSFIQPLEAVPPVPPIPDVQDLGSGISQHPRHRPPFIQTVNLPEQITSCTFTSFESDNADLRSSMIAGLYSLTPSTETRAMIQAQRELCEMLGISPGDLSSLKSRPRSMSEAFRPSGLTPSELARRNSDAKPLTPKRCSRQYRNYPLSPYDVSPRHFPKISATRSHFLAARTYLS